MAAVAHLDTVASRTLQDSWKGLLPALSAHERDFPSEEGSYNKLDEPLTLTGSICRADWVEGMTGVCRTTIAGGGKREDGWTPQACTICNTLESSPCRDIYKKCVRVFALPAEPAIAFFMTRLCPIS